MQWDAFLWPWAAVAIMMALVWVGSLVRKDVSIVDRFWGPGFIVATGTAWWLAGMPDGVAWWVLGIVGFWGLRLGTYITVRNWGGGEDKRYAAMRAKGSDLWPYRTLITVFMLQATIGWLVAAPALALAQQDAGIRPLAMGGAAVAALGILFEAVADQQMRSFKKQAQEGDVMDRGLWRYSRHPNYFGETLVWWGIWVMALAYGLWWTFYGPLLITLSLLKVSGVTILEKDLSDRKPAYQDYVRRTPAFIPWKPKE